MSIKLPTFDNSYIKRHLIYCLIIRILIFYKKKHKKNLNFIAYCIIFDNQFKTLFMNIQVPNNIFKELEHSSLSFMYQGNFSDEITEMVIDLVEHYIQTSEYSKLRKKVSFLMVECFQNVVRHKRKEEEKKVEAGRGFFMTANYGGVYYIGSANLIDNHDVELLKDKLQRVNVLDSDKLKELYFQVLKNEELTKKGGASVGLIEIARKSGQRLDFDFVKVNEEVSFFYLLIKIKSKQAEAANEEANAININQVKDIHADLNRENIIMVHKGNFSQEAIKPILRMVQNNIQLFTARLRYQKIAYHAMVEMLQNVARHSYHINNRKEGIFLIGEQNNKVAIGACNYIDNKGIKPFKEQLEFLNASSKEDLRVMYRKLLRDGETTEKGGVGLGLIDIARETQEKFDFSFKNIDDLKSFFTLVVKL